MSAITEIELVRPQDMLVGPYSNDSETCGCIDFWRYRQLRPKYARQHQDVCLRVFGVWATIPGDVQNGVTKRDVADMYNHCLHVMGFTEGNPPLSEQRIIEIKQKLWTDRC